MQRHSFYTYAHVTHAVQAIVSATVTSQVQQPQGCTGTPMCQHRVRSAPCQTQWYQIVLHPSPGDICPFTQHGHHDTKPLLQHLCCSFPLGCVLFAACQPKPHSPTLCNGGGAVGACSQVSPDHVGVTRGAVKDEERGVVPGSVPTCDAHTSLVQPRVGQPYRCSVWGCRMTLHTSPWAVNP